MVAWQLKILHINTIGIVASFFGLTVNTLDGELLIGLTQG